MTIFKIFENCKGDCTKWYIDSIRLDIINCKQKSWLSFNDYDISCKDLDEIVKDYYYIYIKRGERVRLGKDIYIEYESGKRVYLDYKRYLAIHFLTKVFKKANHFGFEFTYDEAFDEAVGKPLHYISPNHIYFVKIPQEDKYYAFTKNGIIYFNLDDNVIIRKGECKRVNNELILCYGDPE